MEAGGGGVGADHEKEAIRATTAREAVTVLVSGSERTIFQPWKGREKEVWPRAEPPCRMASSLDHAPSTVSTARGSTGKRTSFAPTRFDVFSDESPDAQPAPNSGGPHVSKTRRSTAFRLPLLVFSLQAAPFGVQPSGCQLLPAAARATFGAPPAQYPWTLDPLPSNIGKTSIPDM